jgi:hypothetical protein
VASPWRRGGAPPFLEGFSCSHAGAVHGGGRSLQDCLGLLRRLRWVWVYLLAALPCFHFYVVYGGGRVGLLVLFQPAVASAWVHWELLARGVTGSIRRRRSATHHVSSCPPPPPLDPFDHELHCPVAGSIILRWGSEDRSAGSLAVQAFFLFAPLSLWNYVSTDSWPMMMPL